MSVVLHVTDGYCLPDSIRSLSKEDTVCLLDAAGKMVHFLQNRKGDSETQDLIHDMKATILGGMKTAFETTNELNDKIVALETDNGNLRHEVQMLQNTTSVKVAEEIRTLQTKLMETTERNLKLVEENAKSCARHSEEVMLLKTKVTELETPMGKGRSAELDVFEALKELDYEVLDTSMGEWKQKGYLDLLVMPKGATPETTNMRIAIELKNKKQVEHADLVTFEEKTKSGIEKNLFDSTLFLSIRSHTKQDSNMFMVFFEDQAHRPLVPVTWLGTEKGKHATPLTREEVELQVQFQMKVLEQTHFLREELCSGLRNDDDIYATQGLVSQMIKFMNELFSDLSKQMKVVQELKDGITKTRVRGIEMLDLLMEANKTVSFLSKEKVTTPWLDAYNYACDKVETTSEAKIWNSLCHSKTMIEKNIGKEALFEAAKARQKRKKIDEEDN